jgi:glycosyltransferase involved in cell wall biosynthesis
MNILYLANISLPSERAHAIQIVSMCNGFAENGAKITLAVSKKESPITQSLNEYYGQKIAFETVKIKTFDSFQRNPFLFQLAGIVFAIKSYLLFKSKVPDIIYSREEIQLFFISFLVPAIKLVWESHQAKYSFFVRFLKKRGVKFVVISPGIKNFYLDKGVLSEKILVAQDAIDKSFFLSLPSKNQAREVLGLPADKKIVMYIGGLDVWKGVETFFKASNNESDVMFVVIGGFPEEIKRYKQEYPRVIFLGKKPYKDLKYHQQAADILVIPNTAQNKLSAEYTSPLKLFAYMSSAIPILASDLPSLRSVLNNSEASFFSADNSHSLVESINFIFSDYSSALSKAQKAAEKSKRFTWGNRASEVIKFATADLLTKNKSN